LDFKAVCKLGKEAERIDSLEAENDFNSSDLTFKHRAKDHDVNAMSEDDCDSTFDKSSEHRGRSHREANNP